MALKTNVTVEQDYARERHPFNTELYKDISPITEPGKMISPIVAIYPVREDTDNSYGSYYENHISRTWLTCNYSF